MSNGSDITFQEVFGSLLPEDTLMGNDYSWAENNLTEFFPCGGRRSGRALPRSLLHLSPPSFSRPLRP